MTTPVFIAWLDAKMAASGNGKVIPPTAVMADFLAESLRKQLEDAIRDQILREGRFAEQVQVAMAKLQPLVGKRSNDLHQVVTASLAENPVESWREPVMRLAADIAIARPK